MNKSTEVVKRANEESEQRLAELKLKKKQQQRQTKPWTDFCRDGSDYTGFTFWDISCILMMEFLDVCVLRCGLCCVAVMTA